MNRIRPFVSAIAWLVVAAIAVVPAFSQDEAIGIVMSAREGVMVKRGDGNPVAALEGMMLYRDSVIVLAAGVKIGIVQIYTSLDGLTTFTRFPVYLAESKSGALTQAERDRILAGIGGGALTSAPSMAPAPPPPPSSSAPKSDSAGAYDGGGLAFGVGARARYRDAWSAALAFESVMPFGTWSMGFGTQVGVRVFAWDGFVFEPLSIGAEVDYYGFDPHGRGAFIGLSMGTLLVQADASSYAGALIGLAGGSRALAWRAGLGMDWRFGSRGSEEDGFGFVIELGLGTRF